MPPIRTYSNWNTRASDNEAAIEPYRKYFFICEGKNTETWYFQKLIDLRKTLGIRPMIDIRLLEKTEEDADISYPKNWNRLKLKIRNRTDHEGHRKSLQIRRCIQR